MNKISFGTDGWRAILAEDFTFENIKIISQAMSDYLLSMHDSPSIAIGYDTRFMSDSFANIIGRVMQANKIEVLITDRYIPTPVLSFAVKNLNLDAGIMVTASHNPYYYNGVKFKGNYGGSAMQELTKNIEQYLYKNPIPDFQEEKLQAFDFFKDYKNHIEAIVDIDVIKNMDKQVIFDSMHGAGTGFLNLFLKSGELNLTGINAGLDPYFENTLPEPIPENLTALSEKVKNSDAILGVATDGDADRFGILDEDGNFVQLHDLMPILFEYLIKSRNWEGDIVRTTSMADTIDKLAYQYNRKVYEVPVGFKNVCEKMLESDVLIGGEESGGFGYKNHIPERDGILSILLVLEMLAKEEGSIVDKVKNLRNRFGPFAYDRIDQYCDMKNTEKNMAVLKNHPPDKIAGRKIIKINRIDGVKYYFADNSWMLMRLSQTEPLFRIYVGAQDSKSVKEILQAGKELLTK